MIRGDVGIYERTGQLFWDELARAISTSTDAVKAPSSPDRRANHLRQLGGDRLDASLVLALDHDARE